MTSGINGALALYKGASMEYSWGKWINLPNAIRGVGFSGNGAVVVTHFDINTLMFMRAVDGGLINSQSYPGSDKYD